MKSINARGEGLPNKVWCKTIEDFGGLCAYCQAQKYEELDHFIPKSKGGKTIPSNCLPACTVCNKRKSDATGAYLTAMVGTERLEWLRNYLASRAQSPDDIQAPEPEAQPRSR